MDGLSVALSYDYDFTQLEEMERHLFVPQNIHEVVALQALQIIPHVEITSLDTNKVLKVNGHRLKPFYESWTTEITTYMKNEHVMSHVEPMTQNTIAYWEATQHKNNQICFLFPLSFIFHILFLFCQSPIFLFFYFPH
jgi:hypothetical protein